jgi:GNAT superfamily N-acetyltransferase
MSDNITPQLPQDINSSSTDNVITKKNAYFETIGIRHLTQIQNLYSLFHLEVLSHNPFEDFDDRLGATFHINRTFRQLRQRLIAEERYLGYIAFLDDEPIAYIASVIEQNPSMYRIGYYGSITEFFVVKQLRTMGIGSHLLHLLIDAFKNVGIYCVDIQISTSNTLSPDYVLNWLQKRNFSSISTRMFQRL